MNKSFLLPVFLILFLTTCFVNIENAPCIKSSNCPLGQYCSKNDGKCHTTDFRSYSCEESECGENEFCYAPDNTCHLKDELGLDCNNHTDCPPGQFCNKENICVAPEQPVCQEDKECLKQNVKDARCLEGVCRISKCGIGYEDKDKDFTNGCEEILPCSNDGLDTYELCTGNNVCKCNSDCIILSDYYGIDFNKGHCLEKCSVSDVNKSFNNMLCMCTINEMGVCKKANLFETAMLSGKVRAKLTDKCDDFINGSSLFQEISFTIGERTSYYNRGTACKKIEDGKPSISFSLFKICQMLPCKDIIIITLPQDITTNQTLKSDEAGAMKATVKYAMVDNQIEVQEIWFNAISGAGSIIVENNGADANKIIELILNLKMVRYDFPFCGDIVQRSCKDM